MSNVAEYQPPKEPWTPTALTPLDMLNAAVAKGADMVVLEKLMALHERWEASQARKAFDAAIAEAKAEISPVVKNAKGHNDKRYANLAAIANAVDPVLSAHGLSYRFRTQQTDSRIAVTCILSHREGHSEETTLSGPADTSGNKNAIQAIGSTLTYLQRYSLTQALGLAATEDDDGRASGTGAVEYITDDQVIQLLDMCEVVDADDKKFCKVMDWPSIPQIPARDFEKAMQALKDFGKRNGRIK